MNLPDSARYQQGRFRLAGRKLPNVKESGKLEEIQEVAVNLWLVFQSRLDQVDRSCVGTAELWRGGRKRSR